MFFEIAFCSGAQILDANQGLSSAPVNHQADLNTYCGWLKAKEVLSENDRLMLQHFTSYKVGEWENEFWYTRLHNVVAGA